MLHLLIVLGLSFGCFVKAQNVTLDLNQQPLADALLQLKNDHQVQLSYDDRLVSNCVLSLRGNFENPGKALEQLLKPCGLTFQKVGEVFVIYRAEKTDEKPIAKKPPQYRFQGQVIDRLNREPLPYAAIRIGNSGIFTDLNGNFSYETIERNLQVRASHLGYEALDTALSTSGRHTLELMPKSIEVEGLVVTVDQRVEPDSITDQTKVAFRKTNHEVTNFLPGSRNNTIFNYLRLQPGIMAAGEPLKDYIIWGSYKGQTHIVFDGITLFSNSNLKDNIGAVNPLIVKDIEVYKGGYNVDIGDRVGGFVNITGRSGNPEKFGANLHIDTQVASALVNVPIAKRVAVQAAIRKSYFGLQRRFPIDEHNTSAPLSDFGDLNFKVTGTTGSGDRFMLSLLGSRDRSGEALRLERNNTNYFLDSKTMAEQMGGAFFYGKRWKGGSLTNISLAASQYQSTNINFAKFVLRGNPRDFLVTNNSTESTIAEQSLKIDHLLPSTRRQSIQMGLAAIRNASDFQQDSSKLNIKNTNQELLRVDAYLKDRIQISKSFRIEPGIKIAVPTQALPPAFQPRFRTELMLNRYLRLDLAYGHYRQYFSEKAIVDQFENAIYFWSIADNQFTRVQRSRHVVGGLIWQRGILEARTEAYFKPTDGLTRFHRDTVPDMIRASLGKSRTYGIDFFLRAKLRRHEFSAAYTLSKTEELFSNANETTYRRAPQDQRHELKGVGILNFGPWFISASYVYGSGFPNSAHRDSRNVPFYSRLDAALMYRLQKPRFALETGLSVLNIFNRQNPRYTNFSNFPDEQTIYARGIPLTPMGFLRVGF